jgi:hypothetical protein
MPLVPLDWNVVIIGHWNRAILTPSGISRRLFGLPEGTPVQVFVPLDAIAPYQVRHENITVIAGSDRLLIQPTTNNYDNLVAAMAVARRALEGLPETPITAAGFNLRYRSTDSNDALQELTTHPFDDRLSDEGFEIASRSILRSVRCDKGRIKIHISREEEGAFAILLNFDLQSQNAAEIRAWLAMPAAEIRRQAERILFSCMHLSREEVADA